METITTTWDDGNKRYYVVEDYLYLTNTTHDFIKPGAVFESRFGFHTIDGHQLDFDSDVLVWVPQPEKLFVDRIVLLTQKLEEMTSQYKELQLDNELYKSKLAHIEAYNNIN